MGSPDSPTLPQKANAVVRRYAPRLGRHLLCWSWFYLSILVGHMAKENYFPFSNWPMYANFATRATYVYAIDGHGNEIGWRTTFGQTSAPIKRQYERERNRIQREQEVDRDTANVLGGEVLMERLARRLTADELEEMGGTLTIHYMGVAFNDKRELEHQHKATSVIELAPIIAEKRLEEQEAGEALPEDEGQAEDDEPLESAAPGGQAEDPEAPAEAPQAGSNRGGMLIPMARNPELKEVSA